MSALRSQLWMFVGLFAFGGGSVPAGLLLVNPTNPLPSTHVITFVWDPTPDPKATGYFFCWGLSNGQCTNRFDVLNSTSATLSGFDTNVFYYFSVIAYDAFGEESPPSNEARYVLASPLPLNAPALSMTPPILQPHAAVVSFTFQGIADSTYHLQATADFQHWDTIWSTNCVASAPVTFSIACELNYNARFFRLLLDAFNDD